jgi:hypothetical protein
VVENIQLRLESHAHLRAIVEIPAYLHIPTILHDRYAMPSDTMAPRSDSFTAKT